MNLLFVARSTWLPTVYALFRLPMSVIQAIVVAAVWGVGLALVALPAYNGALPGGSAHMGSFALNNLAWVALGVVVGVAMLLSAPYLTRALAAEDAAVARWLLGPGRRARMEARIGELETSRAGVVDAAETERRRIERDLHDGAQQRLVGLSLTLRLARPRPGPAIGPDLTGLIDQADRELRLAIDELRELAHGIYPAVLADEGLAAAVEALAERSPIPVTIGDIPPERFSGPAEAAGYFLIAEATGLIAALAGARDAAVDVKHDGGTLAIQITGQAAAGPGQQAEAGLADAADRIGALGGHLRVHPVPSGVITIRAEIPCES